MTSHFSLNAAKLYYYSFVYSIISYGIEAWGGILLNQQCTQTYKKIKTIINIIFSHHCPGLNTDDIHKQLSLLKINNIYKYKLMIFFVKMKNNMLPENLQSQIQLNLNHYSLRNNRELVNIRPRTDSIKHHYEYQMINIWNEIPENIKNIVPINKFKKEYKKFVLL